RFGAAERVDRAVSADRDPGHFTPRFPARQRRPVRDEVIRGVGGARLRRRTAKREDDRGAGKKERAPALSNSSCSGGDGLQNCTEPLNCTGRGFVKAVPYPKVGPDRNVIVQKALLLNAFKTSTLRRMFLRLTSNSFEKRRFADARFGPM